MLKYGNNRRATTPLSTRRHGVPACAARQWRRRSQRHARFRRRVRRYRAASATAVDRRGHTSKTRPKSEFYSAHMLEDGPSRARKVLIPNEALGAWLVGSFVCNREHCKRPAFIQYSPRACALRASVRAPRERALRATASVSAARPARCTRHGRARAAHAARARSRGARGTGALARRVSSRAPPRRQPCAATAHRHLGKRAAAPGASSVAARDVAAIAAAAARPRATRSPTAHAEPVERREGLQEEHAQRRKPPAAARNRRSRGCAGPRRRARAVESETTILLRRGKGEHGDARVRHL